MSTHWFVFANAEGSKFALGFDFSDQAGLVGAISSLCDLKANPLEAIVPLVVALEDAKAGDWGTITDYDSIDSFLEAATDSRVPEGEYRVEATDVARLSICFAVSEDIPFAQAVAILQQASLSANHLLSDLGLSAQESGLVSSLEEFAELVKTAPRKAG